jgi:hypothetical protein
VFFCYDHTLTTAAAGAVLPLDVTECIAAASSTVVAAGVAVRMHNYYLLEKTTGTSVQSVCSRSLPHLWITLK